MAQIKRQHKSGKADVEENSLSTGRSTGLQGAAPLPTRASPQRLIGAKNRRHRPTTLVMHQHGALTRVNAAKGV